MDFGSLPIPRLVRQSNAGPLPCHICGTMVDRGKECQDCNKDPQHCHDCGSTMTDDGICQDCINDAFPSSGPQLSRS